MGQMYFVQENKRPDAPIVLIAKRKLEQTEETIIKKQKLSVTDVPQVFALLHMRLIINFFAEIKHLFFSLACN